jgi:DNA-binding NarL/FixJ family response regulator
MSRICCLAGVEPDHVSLLLDVLKTAGELAPRTVEKLDVADLSKLKPDVLIAELDRIEVDPLELLRQLRFVLPECLLVVYTRSQTPSWSRDCHIAGANCVLSKDSNRAQLASGLRSAIRSGCWTDPKFAA